MKKLSLIMALMMVVLALNAQISKVTVKAADLPKAITDNVARNYTGFTIKEATKVTENNIVSYDVVINKGNTHETLVYDKDGKFLRKVNPPTTAALNTGQKPAEKTTPAKK